MEGVVYLLCAATALACGVLLVRGYRRSRSRLLMWCGLCFLLLCAENVVLFIDLVVLPDLNLLVVRRGLTLAGVSVLLFGLVWDAPRR
ncbi:Conserved uncharacterized protein OS=Stigmatella aurantiaca (strain DW4/3-1) GN=STAUR_7570 PE=4 SV=1 [Gemmataceae bacterium]|nr:Conserved uncharacterized protein OS=Stigmatella aurantiaca (strain DW4/3-1) GN=STAUR_7570 PE=4 SV=1 [Gemmataceae bacterium]VTT96846.1 Conserved uncharacterized protein OS=Stigmatella aurantiaca (strain DW4/3-1) GN=STAUR_7570 PE=4 SV=1 [Gemmataceae bacterium]